MNATAKLAALLGGVALCAGAAVACGPSGNSLLGGGDFTDNGSGGGGWGNGGGGPTYNADGGPQPPLAERLYRDLEPDLVKACGSCHSTGANNAPKWLEGPDTYKTIKAYPGFVVADVYASKLLGRPSDHPSSSLVDANNADLAQKVTTWLTAEALDIAAIPLPASDPVDPMSGSVDLTKAGVAGAKITFTATQLGTTLKFDNVQLVAPAGAGVHIVSPVFTMVPDTDPPVDNTDYSTLDLTVAAGQSAEIAPVFYFFDWKAGAKLKIGFQKIESSTGGGGGGDGGVQQGTTCKDVGTFKASAAPTLMNSCTSCHGGNNSQATSALDLTKLTGGSPDYNTACTQARTQVNTANKTQSNILLAPLKQVNHPVQVFGSTNSTGYQNILTWVNKE